MMATIGKVSLIETSLQTELEVEWKISEFSSLSSKIGSFYDSPSFPFTDEFWYLRIYPNGRKENKSVGCISLYLRRPKSYGPSICMNYTLGLKDLNGKIFSEYHLKINYNNTVAGFGIHGCLLRSELFNRRSTLLPSDVLTVFCIMKYPNAVEIPSDIATSKCPFCKEALEAGVIAVHKRCMSKPINCSQCSDVVVLLQNWYDHECVRTKAQVDGSLHQDYKKVLLDGHNHDLIFKVGDKELRAHQDILRSRSLVFKSMLDHGMKEKSSGVIEIADCSPQSMEQFLSYVYYGKVETLDQSNMLELYYLADKYEMMGLKIECTSFIKNSLSKTNICNVIQLALNHSNSDLLEHATEYFTGNVLDIMHTVKWQLFMKDNPTVANELLIKAFKKVKK